MITFGSPRHHTPSRSLVLLVAALACPLAGEPVGDEGDGPRGGDSAAGCAAPVSVIVSGAVPDQADPMADGSLASGLAGATAGCELVLEFAEPGVYAVGGAIVVPSWATLRFVAGARLALSAGASVEINGSINAGRTHIFEGEGSLGGTPLIDAAYPEWFGSVPNDDTDDHRGLQHAVEFFATVELAAGVYDFTDTVVLPSGARLLGPVSVPPAAPTTTLRSTLVYPASEGYFPTRIVEAAAGATDLVLQDLALDGNRHSKLIECWNYPESDNLARFEGVASLQLLRVYLTGYESNWGADDQSLTHVIAVLDSTDIVLEDVRFTDSRVEGILFMDCATVHIERLSTQNVDVWTPLHAFYVEDLTLIDSTIIEDEGIEWSGSTANLTVRGATVTNNVFTGGWGLDFGDEIGTEVYGPRDITVEDNTVETVGAGIYFSPLAVGDRVENVMIRGNTLTLHRNADPSKTDEIIRFDAAAHVVVEDNTVVVPDTGAGFSRGLSFQGSVEDIVVRGNTLTGVDVGVSFSGDSPDGGEIEISGNSITCPETIRVDSWSGGSTGVWVFNYQVAWFESLIVEDNDITAYGGWVSLIDYTSLYTTPTPFMDSLTVSGNRFLPEAGSERNILSDGATSTDISGNTPDWVNDL